MDIYLFDKTQNFLCICPGSMITSAYYTEEINTAGQLTFSIPVEERLAQNIFYACINDPDDSGSFLMFKIIKEDITDTTADYTAIESAYDELASYTFIKDKRPTMNAHDTANLVLEGTRWSLGDCPSTGDAHLNFYYVSILEALQTIVNQWNLEVQFQVKLDGTTNQIKQRNVNMYTKLGKRTNKRFEYGSNLLSVKQENDSTGLYTALVGRGKGVQTQSADGSTNPDDTDPQGYGRRITFDDVEWSTANGNPLNKPKGQLYLEDPQATANYGFPDGHPRIGFVVFEDCEDPNELIQLTYNKLLEVERPQVQFSASIANVGSLDLGDTIAIIRHDIEIEYTTRVFKVVHNLLNSALNTVELGDNLSARNSITQQISNIQNTQNEVTNAIETVVMQGANGNKLYFGTDFPTNATNGDVFYKNLENGGTEMYIYDNGWQLVVSTEQLDTVQKQVDANVSEIADVKQQSQDAVSKADSLSAQLGTVQDAVKTAQGNISSAQSSINQISSELSDTQKSLNQTATDLASSTQTLTNKINSLNTDMTTVQSATVTLSSGLRTAQQLAMANQSNINDLQTTQSSIQSTLASAQGDISTVKQSVSTVQSAVADNKNNISTLQQTASGIQSLVGTLNSENLLINSDLVCNIDGKSPYTNWVPAYGWFGIDNTAVKRCGWYGYSALQIGWMKNGQGLYSAPVRSNQPVFDKDTATTEYNLSFKYQVRPGVYDVYLEGSYTSDFYSSKLFSGESIESSSSSSWINYSSNIAVDSFYPWIRLNIVYSGQYNLSEEENDGNGLLYIAQPMLVYGSTTPAQYISSNQPSQKFSAINQTIDGLQTIVKDNQGNISTVQQTVSGLQSTVAGNSGSISQIKQTNTSILNQVTSAQNDISSLQQTATNLQSSITNNANQISKVAQSASDIRFMVGTLNSDNLLPNSDFLANQAGKDPQTNWLPADGWNSVGCAVQRCSWQGYSALQIGWMKNGQGVVTTPVRSSTPVPLDTSATTEYNLSFLIRNNPGEYTINIDYAPTSDFSVFSTLTVSTITTAYGGWTNLDWSFSIPSSDPWVRLRIISNQDDGLIYLAQPMLVYGSTKPDHYISSNQASQKISRIQQTVDSIQTTVSNNSGDISTLKQTASSLQSSISDAQGDISSLQQTASGLQSTVSNNANNISRLTQTSQSFQSVINQTIGAFYPNGDFNDTDLSKYYLPWDTTTSLQAFSVVTSSSPGGNYAHIVLGAGQIGKYITKEYIPINSNCELEFYGKSSLGYNGSLKASFMMYLHWYDISKNEIGSDAEYYKYDRNDQWQDFDWIFDPPQGTTYVRIESVLDNSQSSTNAWACIDNLTLKNGDSISSKISQLDDDINLTVQKNELISQINIQAGQTLIDTNKLYLNANSVVFSGNAFIPAGYITDLTADRITTGTLNAANVNIINLNVDKLVGNTTSFVQSAWNTAYGSNVNINGNGMKITYGDWATDFGQFGMTFEWSGEQIGGFDIHGMEGAPANYQGLTMNLGANAEYLALAARDYGNVNQSPIPLKLVWMRQGINGYGYNPGWNFCDDVWAGTIHPDNLIYDNYKIKFAKYNNGALALISDNGSGFYWSSDGYDAGIIINNSFRSFKGLKMPTNINGSGVVTSWQNW